MIEQQYGTSTCTKAASWESEQPGWTNRVVLHIGRACKEGRMWSTVFSSGSSRDQHSVETNMMSTHCSDQDQGRTDWGATTFVAGISTQGDFLMSRSPCKKEKLSYLPSLRKQTTVTYKMLGMAHMSLKEDPPACL